MINRKTLSLGSTGTEVESLQKLLTDMGYSVRSSGKFDTFTRQALMDVQNKAGLTITGTLDTETRTVLEDLGLNASRVSESVVSKLKSIQLSRGLPTTGVIDEATLESLEGRSLPENYYTVSGTVYGPDGSPRSDVVVTVHLKGIGAEDLYMPEQRDLLSVTASGRKVALPKEPGRYSIGFGLANSASSRVAARFSRRSKISGGLDIVVIVSQKTRRGLGREIGRGLILNANRNETLDLIVQDGKGSQKDKSEYRRLVKAVSPLVIAADLELGELKTSEIAHLSTLCDFPTKSIALASVSSRNENTSLAPIYYGLARLDLVRSWDELFSLKPDLLNSAITAACEQNLIAISDIKGCSSVEEAVDLIMDEAAQIRLDSHSEELSASPGEMFEALRVAESLRIPFIKSYLSFNGSADSFWSEILPQVEVGDSNEKPFTETVIADLKKVVRVSALTGNNAAAAGQIISDGREFDVLARLTETNWNDLLSSAIEDGTERTAVISDIRTRLWKKFPTAAFQLDCRDAADDVGPGSLDNLAQFLEANPVELSSISIVERLSDSGNLPVGLRPDPEDTEQETNDKNAAVTQLRKDLQETQRLMHVCPRFDVIQGFRGNGLISCQDIARMGKETFTKNCSTFIPDAQEALELFNKARSVAATVAGLYAVSSPGIVPQVVSSDALNPDDIACLESLFGTQDFLEVEPSRSLYSPAAYMVELLEFLKSNDCLGASGSEGTLADVRPDVLNLPLDKANTENLMPYIDLVNETLEHETAALINEEIIDPEAPRGAVFTTRTSPDDGSELQVTPRYRIDWVYQDLAQRMLPRLLPFDLANEQARRFLPLLGTNREEIHQKIPYLGSDENRESPEPYWDADLLGFPPVEYEYLTGIKTGYTVALAWGELPSYTSQLSVREFLAKTGMTFTDLEDFLATPFAQALHLGLKTVGNQWELDQVYLVEGAAIGDLWGAFLDETVLKMDTFLRIWRHLGWTFEQVSRLWMAISSADPTADPAPTRTAIASSLITHAAGIVRIAQRLSADVSSVITLVAGLSTQKELYSRTDDSYQEVPVLVGPSVPAFEATFDTVFSLGALELDEGTQFHPFAVEYDSVVPSLKNDHLEFGVLSSALTTVLRQPEMAVRNLVTELFGVEGVSLETHVAIDIATLLRANSLSRLARLLGRDVTEIIRISKAFPEDMAQGESSGLIYTPSSVLSLIDRFEELDAHDLDVGDVCLVTGTEDGGPRVSDLTTGFARSIWSSVLTEYGSAPDAVSSDLVTPQEALKKGLEFWCHGDAVWDSYDFVLSPDVFDPSSEITGLEFLATEVERKKLLSTDGSYLADEDERISFVIEKISSALGFSAVDTNGWNARIALLRQLRAWETEKEAMLVATMAAAAYNKIVTVPTVTYVPGDDMPFLSQDAIAQLFTIVEPAEFPPLDEEDERISCALTELATALQIEDEVPENTTPARHLYSLLDLYFASNDSVRVATAIITDAACIEGRTLSEAERIELLGFITSQTVSDFQDPDGVSSSGESRQSRIDMAVGDLATHFGQSVFGLGRGIDWYEQRLIDCFQILLDEYWYQQSLVSSYQPGSYAPDAEEAVRIIEGVSQLEGTDLSDAWTLITTLVPGLTDTLLSSLATGSDPAFPEVRCDVALKWIQDGVPSGAQGEAIKILVDKFPLPTGTDSAAVLDCARNVDEFLVDGVVSEKPDAAFLFALLGKTNIAVLTDLSNTQVYSSAGTQSLDIAFAKEDLVFQVAVARVHALSEVCKTAAVSNLGVDADIARSVLGIFSEAQSIIGDFFSSVLKGELAANTLSESIQGIFLRLQKLAFVADILGITPTDIEWLLEAGVINAVWTTESEETFPATARDLLDNLIAYADLKKLVTSKITDSSEKRAKAISRLQDFVELAMTESATTEQMVESCWTAMVDETGQSLSTSEVTAAFAATSLDSAQYVGLQGLRSLMQCIDYSSGLGVDPERLNEWGTPTHVEDDSWMSTASDIRNQAIAEIDKDLRLTVIKPIQDGLRTAQRDALVSFLVSELDPQNINDADDLFLHLLIDVQMGPKQLTSRVKSGISAIQLYVQKIQQGLGPESSSGLDESAQKEWEWKKHYRVWEANRKVFLYPENWLYPEDRDDKTPFFKELEADLQQEEITDESVETAFRHYLEKLDQVARLEIVGVCQETVSGDDGVEEVVLHVVGRTRGLPRKLFHRSRRGLIWSAWEEIAVQIDSDYVLPTMFNNRLHIFWPFVTTRDKTNTATAAEDTKPDKRLFVQIAWTRFQNGKWTSKQMTETGADVGPAISTPNSHGCMPNEGRSRLSFAIGHDQDERLMVFCHYNYFLHGRNIDLTLTDNARVISETHDFFFTRNIFVFDPVDMSVVIRNDDQCYWARDVPGVDDESIRGQIGPKIPTRVDGVEVSRQVPSAWTPYNSISDAGKLFWEKLYSRENPDKTWTGSIIAPSDRRLASVPFVYQDGFVTYVATPTFLWTANSDAEEQVHTNAFVEGTAVPVIQSPLFEAICSAPTIDLAASATVPSAAQSILETYSSRGWGTAGSTLKDLLAQSSASQVSALSGDNELAANILSMVAIKGSSKLKSLATTQRTGGIPDIALNDEDGWREMLSIQQQVTSQVISIGNIIANSDPRIVVPDAPIYRVDLFQHDYSNRFIRTLALKGLDGLLSRDSQIVTQVPWSLQTSGFFKQGEHLFKRDVTLYDGNLPVWDIDFDVDKPFAQYNWEVFFHIPLFIARQLMLNQRFEEAQKWLHFIFDPLHRQAKNGSVAVQDQTPQKYWNVRPFFDESWAPWRVQDLRAMLRGNDGTDDSAKRRASILKQIEIWQQDPFKPHLIARLRPSAYQLNVVMAYIENLIGWGDQLFRQDTMESINEATLLYVMAAEILGRRPTLVADRSQTETYSYNELGDVDEFGNADVLVENMLYETPQLVYSNKTSTQTPYLAKTGYFGVPQNDQLWSLWDTVADRLFKIRHSLNIEGVERTLALFEPPIDPGLLVKATAAGISIADVMNETSSSERPLHRFRHVLNKAVEFTQDVRSLGQSLLAAYEKRDAEEIANLRANQEVAVLKAAIDVRQMQLDEATASLDALVLSQATALIRRDWYKERIKDGPTAVGPAQKEKEQNKRIDEASQNSVDAGFAEMLASELSIIPTFTLGINLGILSAASIGGSNLASVAHMYGQLYQTKSGICHNRSSQSGIVAGWGRRIQEWKLQADMAQRDYDQIGKQIEGANLRVAIAKRELKNLEELQVKNAEAIQERQALKFTNMELYSWMVTELSKVYFSSFDLAYRMARKAQRAYAMETADSTSFVSTGYWDSLRKGLLAGERLFNDLRRLDASFIDKEVREYELTKSISLAQLDASALIRLRSTGECFFDVPEALLDMDHPGHIMRRIKTVSLSIPCTVGPFSGVNATLSLVKNSTRMNSRLSGDKYVRVGAGDDRFVDDSRTVSIATSGSVNDAGLFEVNLHDERYLPFELAGAISTWRLQIPLTCNRFDLNSITDVVLHVKYTAREGGEQLRKKALSEVVEPMVMEGVRLFALKAEHPDQWELFSDTGEFSFAVSREDFPMFLDASDVLVKTVSVFSIGANPTAPTLVVGDSTAESLTFNEQGSDVYRAVGEVSGQSAIGEWVLTCNPAQTLPTELVILVSYRFEKQQG